jgi:dihydropteroate synthase
LIVLLSDCFSEVFNTLDAGCRMPDAGCWILDAGCFANFTNFMNFMNLKCAGQILDLSHPVVMGILNITPDSFYDGGNYPALNDQVKQVEKMVTEGAAIIDIGAVSTRPGAAPVDEQEELKRLLPVIVAVKRFFPDTILSIDTFRSPVAKIAVEHGAGMINDIYGGSFDGEMIEYIKSANVSYVIMHMQGTPETMQINPDYRDVVDDVLSFFIQQATLFGTGMDKIVLDPGFGFGKSPEHNFRLLSGLERFKALGFPIMAGISRKSMINKILRLQPSDALNGTTVLNTIALMKGADILRVHDVKEAMEVIRLVGMLDN